MLRPLRERDIRWVRSAIYVVVGLLTVASGLLDARGFVYAGARLAGGPAGRQDGPWPRWPAFVGGLTAYIIAIKFMQNAGIQGVALQSGIWFVITAIGIAAMDGTHRAMDAHPAGGRRRGGHRTVLAHFDDPRRRGLKPVTIRTHGSATHRNACLPGVAGPGVLLRSAAAHRLPDQQARLPDQGWHSGHAARGCDQARRRRPAADAQPADAARSAQLPGVLLSS